MSWFKRKEEKFKIYNPGIELKDFTKTCDNIELGLDKEYNNYDYSNGSVWYEDTDGFKYPSKSDMISIKREQKLIKLGI
jgi:hypothetical protein